MFEISLPNKLILENVYCNNIHALYRFEIRNVTESIINVKLRSNLGSQVAWQLENENLPSLKKTTSEDSNLFSSTSKSQQSTPSDANTPVEYDQSIIQTSNLVTSLNHRFNELFNQLNHVEEVEIKPKEIRQVILAFLPSDKKKKKDLVTSVNESNVILQQQQQINNAQLEREENFSVFVSNDEKDETFDFFEVYGLLFFFGYIVNDTTAPLTMILENNNDIAPETSDEKKNGLINTFPKISRATSKESSKSNIDGSPNLSPEFQMTVKFRAKVCRSYLWTDIGESGITFDDCIVGGTYYKDFTVWNRSEIDLYWLLNTVDLTNKVSKNLLKFSDYDTGEPFDGTAPVPAYSPRRIRVTFKPTDIGEFNYDLQVENINDSNNTISAHISATVRSVFQEESLVVSSGSLIDFGDCCAGMQSRYRLVLKNISESILDVSFSSDTPCVEFQLKLDVKLNYQSLAKSLEKLTLEKPRSSVNEVLSKATEISTSPSSNGSRASSPVLLREASDTGEIDQNSTSWVSSTVDLFDRADSENFRNENRSEELGRIEELQLRPGQEKTIECCFRPEIEKPGLDFKAGKLFRKTFRIFLNYFNPNSNEKRKEKKTIQCKARSSTSFIMVSPKELDFGDTDVGTLKSLPIAIFNLSELEAKVEIRFISKVLNTVRDEIRILPKQSVEVKVDIYPRKVNPDYRKQITVVNLLNRDNDQEISIRATNIDKHRVTFHSLFYRILTPMSTNFLDFGNVVLNAPTIRTFTIDNISKKKLVLELSSSLPDEIKTFSKGVCSPHSQKIITPTSTFNPIQRREIITEYLGDKKKFNRQMSETGPPLSFSPDSSTSALSNSSQDSRKETNIGDYLDLATNSSAAEKRSPKRKQNIKQTHTLKQFRLNCRERKMSVKSSGDDSKSATSKATPVERTFASELVRPSVRTTIINMAPSSLRTYLSKNNLCLMDMIENGGFSVDDIISLLEVMTGVLPPVYSKSSSEEKYIKAQTILRRDLGNLISNNSLVPASLIEIPPESELMIVLVFTPSGVTKPFIQGKPRKLDSKIFIKLIEFDKDVEHSKFSQLFTEGSNIPSRELMLRSSVCRSTMELGQKNINFGFVDKNEHRNKMIVIRNTSETPLLYTIRKSGSIGSGDIILGEGKVGIVRAYGKREVEFSFEPTLPGLYQEKLFIENIQDSENCQTLTVKANIRKPSNFFIQTLSIDFGVCLINDLGSIVQEIIISNTSEKQTRTFQLKVDTQSLTNIGCIPEITFELLENADEEYFEEVVEAKNDGSDQNMTVVLQKKKRKRQVLLLSKETEEEIEKLEQSLKIAKRKGNLDKVSKLNDKLDKLRKGIVDDEYAADEAKVSTTERSECDSENASLSASFSASKDLKVETKVDDEVVKCGMLADMTSGSFLSPSAKPPNLKNKKNESFIIFTLEPRQIKTVSVSFRPVEIKKEMTNIPLDSSENMEILKRAIDLFENQIDAPKQETCSGNIFVHELKNTDAMQLVNFHAVVCYDNATYLNALEAENQRPELLDSFLNSFSFDQAYSGIQQSSPTVTGGVVNPTSPNPELSISEQYLNVELSIIELGRLELNERKDCYFTLTNNSEKDVNFIVLDSLQNRETEFFEFSQSSTLKPKECKKYYGWFKPTLKGRNSATICIRSGISEDLLITFKWYGVLKSYLSFEPQLDLGFCYVNPSVKFAKVLPFDVTNIADCEIYVTAVSNLALQCIIFSDSLLENTLTDFLIPRNSTITVFVALQPYLSTTQNNSKIPESRTLIGGIKFLVSVVDNSDDLPPILSEPAGLYFQLLTQTVKFTSIIGHSLMNVSQNILDFGVTKELNKPLEQEFYVQNLSSKMPLEFFIDCTDDFVSIQQESGIIPGFESRIDVSLPYSRQLIRVTVHPKKFGLLNSQIQVMNKNSSYVAVVQVKLFVESGSILMKGPAIQEKADVANSVSTIIWEDQYIHLNEIEKTATFTLAQKNKTSSSKVSEASFELENCLSHPLTLSPKSDVDITLKYVVSSSSGYIISTDDDGGTYIGPDICIYAHQRVTVFVCAPKPTTASEENVSAIVNGKKLQITGNLTFENENNVVLGMLSLKSTYCMSRAEIDPLSLNLGKIGHSNSWKEVPFTFTIRNLSEIPFIYNVALSDAIEITKVDSTEITNDHKIATKRKIEAKGIQVISGYLNPMHISEKIAGPHTFNLHLVNLFNPSNDISLNLIAQLTLFELKFERLTAGELVLPTLYYPEIPGVVGSDTWFAIINTSEDDVKFEIGVNLAPDVSEIVRVEILSRFSNTPLIGSTTLAPGSDIEIRVRTYPKDSTTRLPPTESSKYLINPDGITFGSLTVCPKKHPLSDLGLVLPRTVENIPIRGNIVEQPIFSITENHLEFHSFIDSEDEEEKNYKLKRRSSKSSGKARRKSSDSQVAYININNLSTVFPLEFSVTTEYPIELPNGIEIFQIDYLDEFMQGTVAPASSLTLTVTLVDSSISGVSDNVKILITDINSLSNHTQTIILNIIQETSISRFSLNEKHENNVIEKHLSTSPSDMVPMENGQLNETVSVVEVDDAVSFYDENKYLTDTQLSPHFKQDKKLSDNVRKQVINLRGCKKLNQYDSGGLFELDLGQQDLGTMNVLRKIYLESSDRVSYILKSFSENDKSWIIPSRYEGTLEPHRVGSVSNKDSHQITINFMTGQRGVYVTYLVIENVDNPLDTKTIRVYMEVVAKQNVRRTAAGNIISSIAGSSGIENPSIHVFDVYANGVDAEAAEFDIDCFYNTEYSARSIIICNKEAVPLDLVIKSNLSHDDPSELFFSLARASVKLFRTLTVPPESSIRVYIQFIPFSDKTPSGTLAETENQVDEKLIELTINCRLVKDYQKIIPMRALCRQPQLSISADEASFSGVLERKFGTQSPISPENTVENYVFNVNFKQHFQEIVIENILDEDLIFEIFNDTSYFVTSCNLIPISISPSITLAGGNSISTASGSGILDQRQWGSSGIYCLEPRQKTFIQIKLNKEMILKNVDLFWKEKYLIEHLTVYNKNRPFEKKFIVLKLSFGNLKNFDDASCTRYNFSTLESYVVKLLREIDIINNFFE
ncbi:hypothetical protein HK099_004728, partial [Clydaea vesicula]